MSEQDDLNSVEIDEGLHVWLLPALPWEAVSAIKWEILVKKEQVGEDLPAGEIIGLLQKGYIVYGIDRWDLPMPLTRPAVRREILGRTDRAALVAEKADELYSEQVLLPLVRMAATSSPDTSTNGSTSATTGSSAEPRRRSRRSSTSITPTAAIEMTSESPDGGSNS